MATAYSVDWPLTAFSQANVQGPNSFVTARGVVPAVHVAKKSGSYRIYSNNEMQTKGADTPQVLGSTYNRVRSESSSATYECLKYGEEVELDEEAAADADDPAVLREVLAGQVMAKVLGKAEAKLQTLLQTAGNYANTGAAATVSDAKWDASGTSPRKGIHLGIRTIQAATFNAPGRLIGMGSPEVIHALLRASETLSQFQPTMNQVPTNPEMAAFFGLDGIVVTPSTYDSASFGQDATGAFRWNDNFAIIKVPLGQGQGADRYSDCFCKQFSWTVEGARPQVQALGLNFVLPTIERYMERQTDSEIIRARMYYDAKIVNSSAGYLITDCIT